MSAPHCPVDFPEIVNSQNSAGLALTLLIPRKHGTSKVPLPRVATISTCRNITPEDVTMAKQVLDKMNKVSRNATLETMLKLETHPGGELLKSQPITVS